MKRLALLGLVAFTISGAAPVAEARGLRPSADEQVKIGREASQEVRKKEKVLPATDPRVIYMRKVADRLLATMPPASKSEPWEFTFDVIESKEMNAFALPGGPIFFYSGLLEKFKTEDALAGVLAHEITHVRNQHWAYAYEDAMKRQLLIGGLLIILGANRTTSQIAGVANELLFDLPYSRKHEYDADNMGYEVVTKAGYNPKGMVDAFTLLLSGGGGGMPEWISTHPDMKNRIKRLDKRITEDKRSFRDQRAAPDFSGLPKSERLKDDGSGGGSGLSWRPFGMLSCRCHS